MTECWGCASARSNPRSGSYVVDCDLCEARRLAQSPEFAEAEKAGTLTPNYRTALQVVWGERWVDGHSKVKAAAETMK